MEASLQKGGVQARLRLAGTVGVFACNAGGWPDKRLSPNARGHWRKMQPAIIAAHEIGKLQTLNAIKGRRHVREDLSGDEPIALTITFYPPDRRHRDDDNMIAAFKSLCDGMASALKVNDNRFRPTYEFAEPVKGGKIEVRLL